MMTGFSVMEAVFKPTIKPKVTLLASPPAIQPSVLMRMDGFGVATFVHKSHQIVFAIKPPWATGTLNIFAAFHQEDSTAPWKRRRPYATLGNFFTNPNPAMEDVQRILTDSTIMSTPKLRETLPVASPTLVTLLNGVILDTSCVVLCAHILSMTVLAARSNWRMIVLNIAV